MRLSTFAAEPRQVMLGGVSLIVSKLRLADLAALEFWMATAIPRPSPGEDDLPGGWPPTFDTDAGLSLISSGEGIARLVFVGLRRSFDGLTIEQAREIAYSIRDDEFAPFYAAVFPGDDDDVIEPRQERRRVNWHARINAMADKYKYTPDQILDMPLDRFFALGSDPGTEKANPNWEVPISKPEDLDRLWAEREARRAAAAKSVDPS